MHLCLYSNIQQQYIIQLLIRNSTKVSKRMTSYLLGGFRLLTLFFGSQSDSLSSQLLFSLSSSDSESESVPDTDPDPDICQSSLYILKDKKVTFFFFTSGIHPQGICCNFNTLHRNKKLITVISAGKMENCHH